MGRNDFYSKIPSRVTRYGNSFPRDKKFFVKLDVLEGRNDNSFPREGIEIPYPHRTVVQKVKVDERQEQQA